MLRTHHLVALPLVLLLAATPSLRAQYAEAQPGARVRIEAPGVVAGKFVGTVLAREPGIVRVGSQNAQPIDVPINRITSLEISRGKSHWAGAGRGAVIGVPIGAALGLLAAATTDSRDRTFYDNNGRDTLSAGELVLSGAVAGALWGAAIGALLPKEHWERFEVAPRTGFDIRRRMQLGLSLTY
jgi:hypothetical protein